MVDVDADGDNDGILVGETVDEGNWWLGGHKTFAPSAEGAAQRRRLRQPPVRHSRRVERQLPDAVVTAYGFSLGSGVLGDWTINSITFAGTTYTFGEPVVLTGKDQCKDGGWATSTSPVFTNQGACVASFAGKGK